MGEIELGAAAEATIQAYRELATDPGKRLALALDRTCIQFLAYVIAEGEGSLVQAGLETLSLISQEPDCRPSLAHTFGVLEALESLSEDEERYSEELREQAASLYTCLQFAKHIKKSKSRESTKSLSPTEASATPKNGATTTANVASITTQTSLTSSITESQKSDDVDTSYSVAGQGKFSIGKGPSGHGSRSTTPDEDSLKSEEIGLSPRKQQQFLGTNNRKAKNVTLFVNGMVNADHRKLVEDELVRVRGLISIVFDLAHSRVTCRVKRDLSIEKLALAVARTDRLTAQHVIKGANGEEVIQPFGGENTSALSPIDDLPDYLPEEEDAVKQDGTEMATSGTFRETATSFLSTAANIIQKSFYW
ncbi:unnamed protein product [Meganyctiphanes norvegica]|uniref:Armadillo repeat-containing protein 1 n=1 Tax=Meganyctiphanes norvegica TaxID=48144 RepID=A0AAV2Q3L7_MEGNR